MQHLLRRAALTAIRISAVHRIAEIRTGGAGVILRLRHVRPPGAGRAGLLRADEVTPRFLDRMLRMLRRQFDVLAMEEVPARLVARRRWRRFAALTFDVADRDFLTYAVPLLKRHGVPYILYVGSGFIDGVSCPWWLALEDIVLRHGRIGLTIEGREQSFDCIEQADKQILFDHIARWLMSLGDAERDAAIRDLAARYSFDLTSLNAKAMTWSDIVRLAADPLVSIGTSGVNYSVLSRLDEAGARRELKMGQAVTEAALGRKPLHLSYPYGNKGSYGRRETLLAAELGFTTAVTGRARVVTRADSERLLRLPRIAVDGRMQSTAALRVVMSGMVRAAPDL